MSAVRTVGAVTGVERADRWLFARAPAERLAVLRMLVGAFAVSYLAVRLPVFLSLADASPGRFRPVGLLSLFSSPLPEPLLVTLVLGAMVLGLAFTAGVSFPVTGPAFALTLLVLCTYRSSWGQLLHFENLMVLDVLIVGFARSADACTVGRRPRRARVDDSAFGWPVRLAALVTVVTYVLAGLAKLRLGGLSWMVGDTLRNHVAYSAARLDLLGGTPSPVGRYLVRHASVFPPLATATVIVELAAPIALIGGRWRTTWVVSAWLLHAGVAALMFVVFPYPLFLVAFAPFFRLERLLDVLPSTRQRASAP